MATIRPTTLGELQLYKVLQRSNLLSYYNSFIAQGGDDVQQLCEAGEEEFLEIMALVEMASKPLHVRRLQKALQEWVTRPAIFQNIGINYLPSQSIPLTALGIDASELVIPPRSPSTSSNCFTYNRDTNSAPASNNGNGSNRSLISTGHTNGGSFSHIRSSNSKEMNTNSRNENFRKMNSNQSQGNHDFENSDGNGIMNHLHSVVQRLVTPSRTQDKVEVIAKLKADGRQTDLVSALEGRDQSRLEMEIQHFMKTHKTADGTAMSRHEILLNEAAVKLALMDKRYLLKKSDLMALAEKAVSEVENKFSSNRRRSSSHLHGSSCQNRVLEVNNQLQEIGAQHQNLHKRLSEAKLSKNVIRENEYQKRIERCNQEEVALLKERNELVNKTQSDHIAESPRTQAKKAPFSSELADLAKAHNLSFGTLQSSEIVTPTAPWDENIPGVSNYKQTAREDRAPTSNSPSCSSGLSPPQLEDLDKLQNPALSSDSYLVKAESSEDGRYPATSYGRAAKRKHPSGSSHEGKNSRNKKSISSSDVSSE